MFFNVYLITTLISILIKIKNDIDYNNKLYKKGYEYKEEKLYRKINVFLNEVILLLIPFLNIIFAIIMLVFSDSLFDDVFDNLYKEGKLKKIKRTKKK